MNTKTLLGAPLGLALGLATIQPATAQSVDDNSVSSNPSGIYVGAALGVQFLEDDDDFDFNEAGSIDAQLGYRVNDNIRVELEIGITVADIDNSEDNLFIGTNTIGLYYDFQSSDNFIVPFIGGGLGIAGVAVVDDGDDDEDLRGEFTLHADAGVSLNINPYLAIVPSYRYTWTDDSKDVTANNINSHAVRAGLRLSF